MFFCTIFRWFTVSVKMCFQICSFGSKKVQGFSCDRKCYYNHCSSIYKTISQFFEILIFSQDIWGNVPQQALNVDSTYIYVEITSRRRTTWYSRWFNVDLSTLLPRSNSTLNNVDFGLSLKIVLFLYHDAWKI